MSVWTGAERLHRLLARLDRESTTLLNALYDATGVASGAEMQEWLDRRTIDTDERYPGVIERLRAVLRELHSAPYFPVDSHPDALAHRYVEVYGKGGQEAQERARDDLSYNPVFRDRVVSMIVLIQVGLDGPPGGDDGAS
jgi:hypothetical protein